MLESESNIEDMIAGHVIDLMAKGEITATQEQEVTEALRARFTQKGTHGWVSGLKNISYISLMGNPTSAITQIGDLAWAFHRNGIYNTASAIKDAVSGKSLLTKEDIGIDSIAQEFSGSGVTSTAVNKVFQAVGLNWVDNLGKSALISSSIKKYMKAAKNPSQEFRNQLEVIFAEGTDSVLSDLKQGKITENVKMLAFSELSEFQPVSLSEMPQFYLTGGNWRVMYMLKSYTIKQIDVYRNQVFLRMKDEPAEALKAFVRLAAALTLMNASADVIKNLLMNRPTDLSDLVFDNIVRQFGFSKFTIYQVRDGALRKAAYSTFIPPLLENPEDLVSDLVNDRQLKEWESINNIPIGGKLYYWWFGRGRTKLENRAKKDKKKKVKVSR